MKRFLNNIVQNVMRKGNANTQATLVQISSIILRRIIVGL